MVLHISDMSFVIWLFLANVCPSLFLAVLECPLIVLIAHSYPLSLCVMTRFCLRELLLTNVSAPISEVFPALQAFARGLHLPQRSSYVGLVSELLKVQRHADPVHRR